MREKNIKRHLNKKFDEFLKSIEDRTTREAVSMNSFITGGSIVSLLCDEKVNDYDIYFRDQETLRLVIEYYSPRINTKFGIDSGLSEEDGEYRLYIPSSGIVGGVFDGENLDGEDVIEECKPYEVKFATSNAITLEGSIQLVLRFYGEIEDIHKTFDFVHCKNHWSARDNKLTLTLEALQSIINKELTYDGSRYPICSMIRTRKFIKRGWVINAGQYLKMAIQVSKLDLTDMATLKDQLVGVDALYFNALIEQIERDSSKDGFKFTNINEQYIFDLIDVIF